MGTLASSHLLVIKPLRVSPRLISALVFGLAVIATVALLAWLAFIFADGQPMPMTMPMLMHL